MASYVIEFDREACIGCGACQGVCPENWQLKDDKSHPLESEIGEDEFECNRKAEEICPVRCIKISEKKE
ncbi:MAG: ferredoxin [Candidatus Altiarchaeota archaeon]